MRRTHLKHAGRTGAGLALMLAGILGLTGCSPGAEDSSDEPQASTEAAESAPTETAATATDEQIIEAQLPKYPLKTCVVSGEELGSMGEPVNYVHEGRLVRLCCSGCVDDFKSDPEKYLAKLDAPAEP